MRSHAIACDLEKNLSFTTVQVLVKASGTRSGTESLPKVFLHYNCEQISFIIFFAFLKKGRNEKRDSFYTAKRVSSVHSCHDETCLAVFSVPFPQNKFRMCFFLNRKVHTYTCLDTWTKHYYDSNMRCPRQNRTHHTLMSHHNTEPRHNMQRKQTLPPTRERRNQIRPGGSRHPAIMQEQSIAPYSQPSVQSQPNRRNQQRKH